MEEELNENDLEDRFYSMLHHVDHTQDVKSSQDVLSIVENAPRSTVRRYWRNGVDSALVHPNIYQKSNTPKETPPKQNNDNTKPKEEKHDNPDPPPAQLSIFQSPVPQKTSIEIIEHEDNTNIVELETSDEDEVVEVALPPKPTITIESSDDEIVVNEKKPQKKNLKQEKVSGNDSRESSSPVPSVVSSVSDEFIRGDCIALNISSRRPDNHSFDFSLHGADLLGQNTPSKKKKRKKATSTPVSVETSTENLQKPLASSDTCFATPKSKAKNKKQRNIYAVSDKSIPNADVYDSDSNQSIIYPNKAKAYVVNEKSVPSVDVYESDSNHSVKEATIKRAEQNINYVDSSDSSESAHKVTKPKRNSISKVDSTIVDLTDNVPGNQDTTIQENIIMGNVSGFTECDDYETEPERLPIQVPNGVKLGSTKVPAILFENLDFDNLKGKNQVCRNRRYSLTTLRQEMEKFYNESWGGENFNHREIQKYMSRDKSLWAIDPKDKMQTYTKNRKPTCNYCNRSGHRDDSCRFRPAVCYMCGRAGHSEPRCPRKICVRCAAPSRLYTAGCESCAAWHRITCAECGQPGHPRSHCPDMWRRYHNTIELTERLEENHYTKKHYQLYCSGCTRRGHLVHTCRVSLPFSGLPIHSPYVHTYQPVYRAPLPQDHTVSSATTPLPHKRHSKSPTAHETHLTKRRNTGVEIQDIPSQPKSPAPQRKLSQTKETPETPKAPIVEKSENISTTETIQSEAPDFIPIGPTDRDKKGQVIQDNEVSDTSDAITSARIYVTNEIIDKLKTKEGEDWLRETTSKHNVIVQNTELTSFLSIKGKIADQEAFQSALRDWNNNRSNRDSTKSDNEADATQESENDHSFASDDIPRNRMNVLRKIGKALDSLKTDLGEPNKLFKELTYLQNRHQQMMKQKVINPKQLNNNRDNINDMLKKLNMILLGQAGLADGFKHVNELYAIQAKLKSYRQKHVPDDIRSEIGQHYHTVFTAAPRDDYSQLLETFNVTKTQKFKNKKKNKSFNVSPKKKMFKPIPSPHKPETKNQPKMEAKVNNTAPKREVNNLNQEHWKTGRKPLVEKTMNKLVFYHRRLLRTRPNDTVLRRTKVELVRKLHSHIASLGNRPNMSSKALKKMKKIQERAQTFLNNV